MAIYEDEIDLRPYLVLIINNWIRILLISIIPAILVLLITLFFIPKKYEATATILLTRSRTTLSLASNFPTVREENIDSKSRMDGILSIVKSDTIASKTIEALGDKLPLAERVLETLKTSMVIDNVGDSIQIKAKAIDPSLTAEIANTWARFAVEAINLAYSGEQMPAEIQGQLVSTKQEYLTSEENLRAFLQDNQIYLLENKLSQAQTLLGKLINDRTDKIVFNSDRKASMEKIITQAQALKEQLSSANATTAASVGDALAMLKARAGTFAIPRADENLIIDLQLTDLKQLDEPSYNYTNDLDILIKQATDEKDKAEANLQSLTEEVLNNRGFDQINQVGAYIRSLETQIETQQAQKRELTANRDLAWQTYQTMSQKVTEIKNTAQSSNQINLAIQAIPPQEPTKRGGLRNTVIAGIIGLLLSSGWVILTHWWKTTIRPLIAKSPHTVDKTGH